MPRRGSVAIDSVRRPDAIFLLAAAVLSHQGQQVLDIAAPISTTTLSTVRK